MRRSTSRLLTHRFTCLLPLALLAACAATERGVLIEARTQGPVDTLQITVLDLDGERSPYRSSPQPVRRGAADINDGAPIRVAVPLGGATNVLVYLDALTPTGERLVAARCYEVTGLVRDAVLLVGPISTALDGDMDGFPRDPSTICRDPGASVEMPVPCDFACTGGAAEDCDDADETIHPGAPETCADDVDQDCDGEDGACSDGDGDGVRACSATDVPGTCDCDDADPAVNPRADEICNDRRDQDCDGDDALCDEDGDGFPADRPVGGTPDCDDTDPAINPRAIEVCEPEGETPRDNDCNGFVDDRPECTDDDLDRDGVPHCGTTGGTGCDCNDCDPGVRPGADDRCGDGVDANCDGMDRPCPMNDADRDGFPSVTSGGTDCDDMRADAYPGAPERCGDGILQSCLADVPSCAGDADMDGYVEPADCGEDEPTIAPGVADVCNGRDDDCDGTADDVLAMPGTTASGIVLRDGDTGCVVGDVRVAGCVSGACELDFVSSAAVGGSVFHCGGCRRECNQVGRLAADLCLDGACDCAGEPGVMACGGGRDAWCCDTGCEDLTSDLENCGSCGFECGVGADACTAEVCTCRGSAECGRTADGAQQQCCGAGCADVRSDELNCGRCGNVCGPQSTCQDGICTCDANYADCDGNQASGCEIDTRTALAHCGGCGRVCMRDGATEVCDGGVCRIGACDPLRGNCDTRDGNGCEQPLTTLTHCAGCGVPCAPPNAAGICATGTCQIQSCNTGFADCNAAAGCETSIRTLTDCNGCGVVCARAHATATCGTGACRIQSCDSGYRDCNGADADGCEIDTQTDVNNCGMCGRSCGANATCSMGACMCVGTFRDCSAGSGCETDSSTSLANCGACAASCASGESCSGGRCACGASAGSIGGGAVCVGQTCCPGGVCRDLEGSTGDCGACGVACGSMESCASGRCECGATRGSRGAGAACGGGTTCCSGGCVNTSSSAANCGMCGRACGAGEACDAGTCECAGGAACTGGTTCCASGCTDTSSDESNCGGCGIACGADEVCSGGRCTCGGTTGGPGAEACSGALACCSGTCTDLTSTGTSCGACGVTCGSGESCSGSRCTCGGTTGSLGAEACLGALACCSGTCADLTSAGSNCGACGVGCGIGETCASSACTCGDDLGSIAAGPVCVGGDVCCITGGGMLQCAMMMMCM